MRNQASLITKTIITCQFRRHYGGNHGQRHQRHHPQPYRRPHQSTRSQYQFEGCLSHHHWQDRHGGWLGMSNQAYLTTNTNIADHFRHYYGGNHDQWHHRHHRKLPRWYRQDHRAHGLLRSCQTTCI